MASVFLFVFFLLSHLLLLLSAQKCRPFRCEHLDTISFPFATKTKPECGIFTVDCTNQTIQLEDGGKPYKVLGISQANAIRINDTELWKQLDSSRCESLTNLTFSNSSFVSFEFTTPTQTFFKCNRSTLDIPPQFIKQSCDEYNIYYSISSNSFPSSLSECSIIQLPKNSSHDGSPGEDNLFELLTAEYELGVHVSDECNKCHYRGGQCKRKDKGKLDCLGADKGSKKKKLAIGLGQIPLQSNLLLKIDIHL